MTLVCVPNCSTSPVVPVLFASDPLPLHVLRVSVGLASAHLAPPPRASRLGQLVHLCLGGTP
jgi:hypothetical protein